MAERIQKLISEAGLMSRRAAEQAITEGRVQVNGVLNKPKGYVTSLHDEKGRRCVEELVRGAGQRVYPVGRLDLNSEGLLLMTNDGEFANRVMHPSHELDKCYHTWVMGEDVPRAVNILHMPLEIDGYRIRPAKVEILKMFPGGAMLSITIHEGRNRQVRKMCALAGLKVTRLVRVSEGGLTLSDLRPGCWRELSEEERNKLFSQE